MTSIQNLMEFKDSRETPVLVLVDLHSGIISNDDMQSGNLNAVLENCRTVLAHARALDLPIAFLRQAAPAQSLLETRPCPAWIKGFEPRRADMVFDRALPSGYASPEFAKMIDRTSRTFVLAGLSAEMSCLSTAVEAFHRHHQVTYLADACFCSSRRYFSPAELEKGVTAILSLYGAISTAAAWVNISSRALAGVA